jgi:hypothetical protein
LKRTDSEGHVTNRYTEGNPATGVPATVVGAEEMNNIQEEIVNVVLDAGIALNGAVEDQMLTAIKTIINRGVTQYGQTVANNQTSDDDLTGVIFDKTDVKAARMLFNIHRRTDTQNKDETGEIYVFHNTETDAWDVKFNSFGDDAEVTFAIDATGQLSYQSSNLTGAAYSGEIKITDIKTIAQ